MLAALGKHLIAIRSPHFCESNRNWKSVDPSHAFPMRQAWHPMVVFHSGTCHPAGGAHVDRPGMGLILGRQLGKLIVHELRLVQDRTGRQIIVTASPRVLSACRSIASMAPRELIPSPKFTGYATPPTSLRFMPGRLCQAIIVYTAYTYSVAIAAHIQIT